MGTTLIDLFTSWVQHIQQFPSVYFILFSSPRLIFTYYCPIPSMLALFVTNQITFSPPKYPNTQNILSCLFICRKSGLDIIAPKIFCLYKTSRTNFCNNQESQKLVKKIWCRLCSPSSPSRLLRRTDYEKWEF